MKEKFSMNNNNTDDIYARVNHAILLGTCSTTRIKQLFILLLNLALYPQVFDNKITPRLNI